VSVPDETFTSARIALARVLRSLLLNAIKRHDCEDVKSVIDAWFYGDECLIDFKDDGPGIAEVVQRRGFGLFERLSGSMDQGSEMCLAIARRLAEGQGA
jgi:signal transduction histidine kinase